MSHLDTLITDHLDLWSAAVRPKISAGRGSNSKLELTGIKKLRELILELAVRGKLVPQDPSDEPASVLLGRIIAAKALLVKDKKIKKEKPLPAVSYDETTFELPMGWEWVRLQSVTSKITDGDHKTPSRVDCGMRMLSAKNVRDGYVDFTNCDFISNDDYLKSRERCLPETGDLMIVSVGGTIGRSSLVPEDSEFSIVRSVALIKPLYINSYYLKCLSDSPLLQNEIHEKKRGGAQPCLYLSEICKFPLPLPPIQEQARIVAKVDELMALCDQLEQHSESQLEAHQTLVETLISTLIDCADADELAKSWARLSTHFDTLFTTEASIDALKQTILQLAVMGKLVPQDPSDEPAIELLNRLVSKRDEWLKKESKKNSEAMTMLRKLKKLTEPKAPFELPKSWACVYLIQLTRMLVDCHNKTAPYVDAGIPIIRTTNIRDRQFIDKELKFISQDTYDYWSRRCPPEQGDIIFTREAPMGEALIIPVGEKWCLGQRTMLIRPTHAFVSNEFLLLALTEPNLLERASEHAVGLTVKHLRVGDVENLNIPLPPLAEQHRIVAKVDELMSLCDQLKSRLQTSQQTQLALAESLVAGALV